MIVALPGPFSYLFCSLELSEEFLVAQNRVRIRHGKQATGVWVIEVLMYLLMQHTPHYEDTPIHIYWKFYNQKRKIFR